MADVWGCGAQALWTRKQTLEQQEAECNLALLLQFLHHSRRGAAPAQPCLGFAEDTAVCARMLFDPLV